MAEVEIPVVIDIEGAFEDAANRVSTAMKPLQREIEKSTASIKLDISGGALFADMKSLDSILKSVNDEIAGTNYAFERLKYALDDAKERLNLLYATAAKNNKGILTPEQSMRAERLREAIILLEAEIDLRTKAGRLASEAARKQIAIADAISKGDDAMNKMAITAHDLNEQIGALRGKLSNLDPNSQEWKDTAKAIKNATDQLSEYDKKLKQTLNPSTKPLAGSINRIKAEMNDLTEKWNAMSKRAKFDENGNLKKNAQALVDKYKELAAQAEKYGQSLEKTANANKGKIVEVNEELGKQSSLFKDLAKLSASYISITRVFRFVKQIRDVTGELEYQRVALGHLLGDVQFGNELFEKTIAAAQESPFRITQLVTFTKQLAAYRIEQENLFETTQRLADISAGLGVDMNRLILAYGQVRAASVLRGQELRQFTEAGIPLVDELAKKFRELGREGTTTADVFKLISERAVPFSMIKEIFEDLTNAGGMFYKMQEEQAKTLKGRWEKLKDAYDKALMSIGEDDTFQKWNDTVLKALNGIANNLKTIVRVANAATMGWVAYKVATSSVTKAVIASTIAIVRNIAAQIKLFGVMGMLRNGVVLLKNAFIQLKTVMLTTLPTALITAGATLLTFFTTFKTKTKEATAEISDMQKAIEALKNANKDFDYGRGLIAAYGELAKKTEKTDAESRRLATTVEELKRLYPDLTSKLDDDNVTLEEKIRLLGELSEAQHEQAIEEAKERLSTQGGVIRGLEDDLASAKAEKDAAEARRRQKEAEEEAQKIKERTLGIEEGSTEEAKRLAEASKEAAKQAKAAEEAYDGVKIKLAEARAEYERLEELAFPDKVKKDTAEWQNMLIEGAKYKSGGITKMLFTPDDVKKWESLGEAIKKLRPQFKEAKETYFGLESQVAQAGSKVKSTLIAERDAAKDAWVAFQLLDTALGGLLSKALGGTTRDTRLSQLKSDISELTNAYKKFEELKKYKSEDEALIDIKKMFPQLDDLAPTFDNIVKELEKKLEKVKADLAKSPKSKTLLDMQRALETEISNLKFDQLKRVLEQNIKRVSEELKRSEAARNFYKDIFDMTGDQELASTMTISIYGDLGQGFRERMQQKLNEALASLDSNKVTDDLRKAFTEQDWAGIAANIGVFSEAWQKELNEMIDANQKFSAEQFKTWAKELQKAKTYSEQRIALARLTQERIAEIESSNLKPDQKKQLVEQYNRREQEEAAKLQYEAFKETPFYTKMFDDLESVSTSMLTILREKVAALSKEMGKLDPKRLKEMQSRLNAIDTQLGKRNPFKQLADSIKLYNELVKSGRTREGDIEKMLAADQQLDAEKKSLENAIALYNAQKKIVEETEKKYGKNSAEAQAQRAQLETLKAQLSVYAKMVNKSEKLAEETTNNANEWDDVTKGVKAATAALTAYASHVTAMGAAVSDLLGTVAGEEAADTTDRITKMTETTVQLAAAVVMLVDNLANVSAWAQGVAALVSIAGQIVDWSGKGSLKSWGKQMEAQDKIVARLTRKYERLDYAIKDAFGSEYLYNYNEQLKTLAAEAEALNKQLEIQQEKAKKASGKENKQAAAEQAEEIAAEYAKVQQTIQDKTKEMQEYFAGSSLSQAAEEFASAWLDAYQSYASTTDAIKEKMEDMVKNLVIKAAMAGLVESLLAPWYRALKEAQEDNSLVEDIPTLISGLYGLVDQIDGQLNGLSQVMQSYGYNMRSSLGNFRGISRDIASASEESILGLAAGINTQNYYMQHIDESVAQIVAMLSGGVSQPMNVSRGGEPNGEAAIPSVQQMVYDYLPYIQADIAEMKSLLQSVISDKNANTSSRTIGIRIL